MSDTDKYQEDSMKQKERKMESNKKQNSRRKAGRVRKNSNRRRQTFSHNPEDWDWNSLLPNANTNWTN